LEPIVRKTYYSIGEVSDLAELKPHVLRYWETQFDVLSPIKRGGSRVYRTKDIETILLVKHLLYEKRFTIAGANKELKTMRDEGRIAARRKDIAEPAVLDTIKASLQSLREDLTLPPVVGENPPDARVGKERVPVRSEEAIPASEGRAT